MRTCIISGKETNHNFKNLPVHKEVLEFARRYRDAIATPVKSPTVHSMIDTFIAMQKFGHTWDSIKKKLLDELKDKNLTF